MLTPMIALEIAWKASAVLCAGALATYALRGSSAALRHLIWTVVLAAVLVLPVMVASLPSWRVSVLPTQSQPRAEEVISGGTQFSTREYEGAESDSPSPSVSPSPSWSPSPSVMGRTYHLPTFTLFEWILIAWLAGAAGVLAWVATGFIAVIRLARRSRVVCDPALLGMLDEARRDLRLDRSVQLLQSGAAVTPMTFGVMRSVIVLPVDAVKWARSRQRVVLLHELAHIGRRDVLLQLVAQLACAFYWFHPLVWYASRRLRAEREHACDDAVVRAGERPSEYATHLLDVARAYRSTALLQPAALAMARQSQLEGRLLAVLKPDLDRSIATRTRIAISAAVALGAIAPLSAFTPIAREVLFEQTAEVIRHPRPADPLSTKFDWAFAQGNRASRRGYWVGYSITRQSRAGQAFISGSNGFNINQLNRPALETQLFGTRTVSARNSNQLLERDVAILFRFERGANNIDDAIGVRIHSMHVGMDLENVPVVWLGDATDAQSIEWLRAQFESTKNEMIRDELVEAVGVHQRADLAVPFLLRVATESTQPNLRAQAAEALGDQGSPRAMQALKDLASNDASLEVRREAAEALGQSQDQDATAALLNLARTAPDEDVRMEATEALGEQNTTAAAAALRDLVFDGDMDVMREAAEALGELEVPAAIGFLKDVVQRHPRWQIRAEAVQALGDKPAEQVLPILERVIFDDVDARVQEDAVEALSDLGRAAVSLARRVVREHPNRDVREKAADILEELDGRDDRNDDSNGDGNSNSNSNSNSDWPGASDSDSDSESKTGTRQDLVQSEYFDARIDESKLISAVEARGARDSKAILALLANLNHVKKHEMDLVRERSVWALSLVRNGEIVAPLLDALKNDDWKVRAYAAWALVAIKDPRASRALMAAAQNDHWRVRVNAIYGLGDIEGADMEVMNILIAALDDPAWQVRAAAAENIGDRRSGLSAEGALQRLVADSHLAVRGAAQESLKRLTSR